MSTLLYASLTRQRERAPAHTSTGVSAAEAVVAADATDDEKAAAADKGKPGVSTFVDAMAALVPAEVLLAHGLLIELGTSTKKNGDETVTTITEPGALKALFVVLAVTALALYVIVHLSSWQKIDFVRMLFPPLAFAAWTMLQKATMFDAWAPNWSQIARLGTAAVVTLLVGALAKALADRDDALPAKT